MKHILHRQRQALPILLILLVSTVPFLSILFTGDLPHTSDGGVHLPRMGAYFKALMDGHIPVRWAGDLNYGYGLPLFNFIYQLPYLVTSSFLLLGLGLVSSFKLTLLLSFLLSGVFMYLFMRQWLGDTKKAVLLSLMYQFAPFRLIEILVRGAIGGIYAYTFLPLVLLGLVRIAKNATLPTFLLTSVATALLIISHNSLSLVFFAGAVLFTIFFVSQKRSKIIALSALSLGLLLAAFFWLPAIVEHKYTYGDLFMKDLYKMYFPVWWHFFVPNITDSASLRVGEISVSFGLFHIIALIVAMVSLIRGTLDTQTKRIVVFALTITAIVLVFMQPLSLPLWERISFLRQFQFPWRFLAVICFTTTLLSLPLVNILVKKPLFISVLSAALLISMTAIYWYPRQGFDRIDERAAWNYPLNTTYFGETDVIWSAGPAKAYPQSRVEFIEGTGVVSNFQKKTQLHTFTVDAATDAKLVDHTQYFPGWRVYVNGVKTPVEFQDQNYRGEITFAVPKGTHQVSVAFEESPIRFLGNSISIIATLSVCILSIIAWRRKKRSHE
jgi:hypothetical protein